MIIKDIYSLERSEEFSIKNREEVTVNLTLSRVPCDLNTSFKGKVIDQCGKPIPDATVKVFSLDYVPIEHTTTDKYGNFLFKDVLQQGKYYVIATAEKYTASKSYHVTIIAQQEISLTVKLCRDQSLELGTIYGIIRDNFGRTIDDAVIIISKYEYHESIKATTKSNSDGEYLVCGLRSGKYWVYVKRRGYVLPNKVSFIIKNGDMISLYLELYEETHQK